MGTGIMILEHIFIHRDVGYVDNIKVV